MSIRLQFDYKKHFEKLYGYTKKTNIAVIVIVVLALHFFVMSTPADGFIFDESHYVPAARDTVRFIAANAEHTPLSKVVIGYSISLFGDWWFAWRITPVLFSTLSVLLVYLIARQFLSKKYSLFASAFMGLDILFFVNGSIAILDSQAVFFGLFGVWLLLKKRYGYSALMFGVAVLSKEAALFILAGSLIYLLLNKLKLSRKLPKLSKPKFSTLKPLLTFFLIFSIVVFGGVYAYDIIYKPATNSVFIQNVAATVITDNNGSAVTTQYVTSNTTSHDYITNPIQHFIFAFQYYSGLTPTINPEAKDFRPPWSWALPLVNPMNPPAYYQVSVTGGARPMNLVGYFSQVSYPITVFIVPTLAFCFWILLKHREALFAKFYLGWLTGAYLPWILFGLFIQKMTFNYYFIYTVPILNIGAAWVIQQLPVQEKYRTAILYVMLFAVAVWFMYYFPLNVFRSP
jgi:4-amino-4-deoxy-L-arabinose transferase-like glycosyltransferase